MSNSLPVTVKVLQTFIAMLQLSERTFACRGLVITFSSVDGTMRWHLLILQFPDEYPYVGMALAYLHLTVPSVVEKPLHTIKHTSAWFLLSSSFQSPNLSSLL